MFVLPEKFRKRNDSLIVKGININPEYGEWYCNVHRNDIRYVGGKIELEVCEGVERLNDWVVGPPISVTPQGNGWFVSHDYVGLYFQPHPFTQAIYSAGRDS